MKRQKEIIWTVLELLGLFLLISALLTMLIIWVLRQPFGWAILIGVGVVVALSFWLLVRWVGKERKKGLGEFEKRILASIYERARAQQRRQGIGSMREGLKKWQRDKKEKRQRRKDKKEGEEKICNLFMS